MPYRGSSQQAIAALISGDVCDVRRGHVHGGAVRQGRHGSRARVTSPQRIESLPDAPTFAEAGYPGMDYSIWFAVLAPSGTPPAIIRKLHDGIAQAVADPDYRQQLRTRGFEAVSNTPEDMAAFLQKDYLRSKALIEKLGISVE